MSTKSTGTKVERSARLKWVPIVKAEVNPLAQRELKPTRVEELVDDFDLEQLGSPTVNQRGDQYHIIDGQHRIAALKEWFGEGQWENQQIQCWTYQDLTDDEEAEIFLRLNNTLAVTAMAKFRLGWSEQCKDGTKMGAGSPEYILLFHKPQTDRTKGYADVPVTKDKADYTRARWQVDAHAFWRSSGQRHLTPDELAALPHDQMSRLFTEQTLRQVYDYEAHIRIGEALEARGALPATFMALAPGSHNPDVWHDVNRMLTLNTEQSRRAQAMHVCPLQFDIVDRLIRRYSNEGDLVYDPFGGLSTVPVRALKLGRQGRSVELNPGYFFDGVKYLQAAEAELSMPTLFDLAEVAR